MIACLHHCPCRLKALGLEPHVKADLAGLGRKFANVAFSAPPSGSQDYGADVSAGGVCGQEVCEAFSALLSAS